MNEANTEARRPLVALLLAPDPNIWRSALNGEKTITIRLGTRDYRESDTVMLSCHIAGVAAMADVTSVKHTMLLNITYDELRDNGFSSYDDMLAGLRRFYPDATWQSPVTIIRWANVRGTLVEDQDKQDLCLANMES